MVIYHGRIEKNHQVNKQQNTEHGGSTNKQTNKQNKTKQNKTQQNKTKQNKTKKHLYVETGTDTSPRFSFL